MTQYLPPNLLSLFAARDPIPFLPPVDKLPYEKHTAGYSGIGDFVKYFEDPDKAPPPTKIETREERRENKRRAKAELTAYKLEQDIALWSPSNNPKATIDAYKTLFVARINYDTSEVKLRREFEMYGAIKKIVIVHDVNSGKPRGYAFIEYEHERDMRSAYKHADGKKIEGRRVLVDVERGRIVKNWLPRRLGGGLGGTRLGGPDINLKHSGRTSRTDDHYIGGGKDRPMDRDRGDRSDRRRRSRSREKRRRSRSSERKGGKDLAMSRDRHHDRPRRDRSRDRGERMRGGVDAADAGPASAEAPAWGDGPGADGEGAAVPPPSSRKERRRSRSRDRKRSRRSRSRDRGDRRSRRDHDRDRDKDKDRESRRERKRDPDRDDRNKREQENQVDSFVPPITIKEEPMDEPESTPDNYNNNNNNDVSGYGGDYGNYGNNGDTNSYDGF